MPKSFSVFAKTIFEIEVELSGNFQPGSPARGPTYASGGEPADPDVIEDIEISAIQAVRPRGGAPGFWDYTDLLANVDRANPEVVKLLDNILTYLGDEAEEALLQEGYE